MSRLPKLINAIKICIICEGNEEYEYLNRLIQLNVWNEKYKFYLDNAGGNGNIPARYQNRYQNNSYELVLVFCDTEKKPYEQYKDIKNKINEFHGTNKAADEVIMFANPCTMQIIIKHWENIKLKTAAKKMNAPYIKEYTDVENYKGRLDQIHAVMKKITKDNYLTMKKNIELINGKDSISGTSNFFKFINFFEQDDECWIKEINNKLEMN